MPPTPKRSNNSRQAGREGAGAHPGAAGHTPEVYRTSIRVSDVGGRDKKDGRRGRFLSPEDQLGKGRDYARRMGGVHDDDASLAHADLDQSGYTKTYLQRPGIMAHLEDARAGLFQHLCFAYTERSSRDVLDGLLLAREFAAAGVQVHYLDISADHADPDYTFQRDLNLLLGSRYSQQLSRKLRSNFLKRAEGDPARGIPPLHHGQLPAWLVRDTGPAGYGGTGEVIPYAPFVSTLRRLIDLRISDFASLTAIARTLNAEGLLSAEGRPWSAVQVCSYLSPSTILRLRGYSVYHSSDPRATGGPDSPLVNKILPPAFGPETDAILDRLEAVQRELAAVRPGPGVAASRTRSTRRASSQLLLSGGLAVCAVCAAAGRVSYLTGEASTMTGGKRWPCYACRAATEDPSAPPHGGKHGKPGLNIGADPLHEATLRCLRLAVDAYTAAGMYTEGAPEAPPKKGRRGGSGAGGGKGVAAPGGAAKGEAPPRPVDDIEAAMARAFALHDAGDMPLSAYKATVRNLESEMERRREWDAARQRDLEAEARSEAVAGLRVYFHATEGEREEVSDTQLSVWIGRLVSAVEAPHRFAGPDGSPVKVAHFNPNPVDWAKVVLRDPLPEGSVYPGQEATAVLWAPLHRESYTRERRVLVGGPPGDPTAGHGGPDLSLLYKGLYLHSGNAAKKAGG